jgi:F0F1-type ATP synthase assembly protein I
MRDDIDFEQRLNDALKRNNIDLTNDKPIDGDILDEEGGDSVSGLAYGMRIGIEFLSGTVVGFLIGWGVDKYFDTAPWGLLIFVILGFFAGLLNVFRDINNIQESIGINRHNVLTNGEQSSKS